MYASINGYTYCLDALTGQQLWDNPMPGFGFGTTSLATSTGHTNHSILGQAAADAQAASAASSSGS